MINLITVVCLAPLAGATKRKPEVIHAITLEAGLESLLTGRKPVAACGTRFVRFLANESQRKLVVWPFRDKGELTRCRECWIATGKRPPRKAGA